MHWCLWAHGGNVVDKNDKVIINSPETVKALEYAKALYAEHDPGIASWNDASNNKAFLAGEIHWTNNGISIYVAAKKDPTKKEIADDMNHAYWPIGPVGKPTELHLMYPILAMTYTKYPQACKALMAFMLEADNFNPWIESAQGYLTHCLNAYDTNPVWTADPKNTVFGDVGQAHADRRRPRLGRREGGDRDRRLRRARHVRQLLHRPRRRQGRDRDRRAAAEAHLSVAATLPQGMVGRRPNRAGVGCGATSPGFSRSLPSGRVCADPLARSHVPRRGRDKEAEWPTSH